MIVVRPVTWILSALCIYATYRWASGRSQRLATIFLWGIAIRVMLGGGLFLISALGVPVLKSLQMGSGFWTLAIDAKSYFDTAAAAAEGGLGIISDVAPSPTYLRVLAAWLTVGGISPLSAVLFNLLCYVGVALVIVASCRSAANSALALTAITIEPALLLFGSQVLKDSFCLVALTFSIAGVRVWCDGLDPEEPNRYSRLFIGLVLIATSIYVIAGIRPYVDVFVMGGLVVTLFASAIRSLWRPWWRTVLANAAMLAIAFRVFATGAGPYFDYYESLASRLAGNPSVAVTELDHARAGFVGSGGATALVNSVATAPSIHEGKTGALDVDLGFGDRTLRLLRGVAALLIPISLLRSASIVTFSGGRGLLFITDIDTTLIDVALTACVIALVRARPARAMIPLLAFVTSLSLFATVVLAYVVTNFGTLFRLRLLAVMPLLVLPALVRRSDSHPLEREAL